MLAHKYYDQNQAVLGREYNDPYTHLAAAIIAKAAEDYIKLADRDSGYVEYSLCNKIEIINFFKSEWCELLACWQAISPREMLEALQAR